MYYITDSSSLTFYLTRMLGSQVYVPQPEYYAADKTSLQPCCSFAGRMINTALL